MKGVKWDLPIQFEHHLGQMDVDRGYVTFYNIAFDSIVSAARFLRRTPPGDFKGVYRFGSAFLVDKANDLYYDGERWVPGWRRFKRSNAHREPPPVI